MDTRLTDNGLANLAELKKLERIDVEGTDVSDDGVAKLRESLPHAKIFH